MTPLGIFTVIVGLAGFRYGAGMVMSAFVLATLLGSSAAILIGSTQSIQPAHLLLGFVAPIIMLDPRSRGALLKNLTFPREGFWLFVLASYSVCSAFFAPRLFAGQSDINPVGLTAYGATASVVPLGPTSGNISQSIYIMGDVVCFFCVMIFARTVDGVRTLVKLLVAYAIADIVFAFLDIATFWTNTGYLLGFIRNANYAFHLEEAAGNLKRIAGSFTEASAFSYATVGSLAFTARLWMGGYKPLLTLTLSIISFLLLLLSTSSTALVATFLLLAYLYASSVSTVAFGHSTRQSLAFFLVFPLLILVIVISVALNRAAAAEVKYYLDFTIFEKATSDSGVSRAALNTQALKNFMDTWGIGGGLGSIRASSFGLAVLSNIGIVGAALFLPFFACIFVARRSTGSPGTRLARSASRAACVGLLFASLVSGTLVDLGLPFFIFAALSCADPVLDPKPQEKNRAGVETRGRRGSIGPVDGNRGFLPVAVE
jgi:hypothetical protein